MKISETVPYKLKVENGPVVANETGNKYCSRNSQNDLEISSGLFPTPISSSPREESWPPVTDPKFNEKITSKLSGVSGSCSYVMKNGNKPIHSCSFPSGMITWNDLSPYQSLVSSYINPDTKYRGVLVYHGLGSGKTLVGISVMSNFLQKEPSRTIIFLGKPGLKANFLKDLAKVGDSMLFGTKKTAEERAGILKKKMVYVTFEEMANRLCGATPWNLDCNLGPDGSTRVVNSGLGTLKGQIKADSKVDALFNNTLIIIDEAHNLVKQLSKPIYPDPMAAAVVLSAIRNATNVRLVFLTATPIQQESYEIGILLNLLIPPSSSLRFPEFFGASTYSGHTFESLDEAKTKTAFETLFIGPVGTDGNRQIVNQEKFLSITRGLVSYYPVDFNYSQFARPNFLPIIYVPMSDVMLDRWAKKRREELKESGDASLTCSLSNADSEVDDIDTDNESSGSQKPKACAGSLKASSSVANNRPEINQWNITQFKEYAPKIPIVTEIISGRYDQGLGKQMIFSSTGDVGIYALTKYLQSQGWTYWDYETKVSSILQKKYGPKFADEVRKDTWCNSGKKDAFVELDISDISDNKSKGFVVLNGEITEAYKVKVLVQLFNSLTNIDGSRINLIILNTKYSEGLSLMTTTAVHILEPPRSMALLSQITARAIRMCSHMGLSYPEQWKVDVFRYMITSDAFKTVDPLSYVPSKSSSSSMGQISELAKKEFGGDMSLAVESGIQHGGQDGNYSQKKYGTDLSPKPQRTKKVKDMDFLQSKCSDLTTVSDCNSKDYCGFDEDRMKCRFLGTESSIFKVAKIKGVTLETFLTLLRATSLDCAIFKSMHDPNNRVSCHLPLNSSSSGTELSSSARIVYDLSIDSVQSDIGTKSSESECSIHTDETSCNTSRCNFKGKNCLPKCELFNKTSSICESEPRCRYEKGGILSSSKCHPRFPLQLLEKENSFGFSTKPHINRVFLKEVEIVEMELSQTQVASSSQLETLLEKPESLTPSKLMHRLQKFLEMEGYMPITGLVDKLIEIVKGRIQKPLVTQGFLSKSAENWRDTKMFRTTTNVMRLMTLRRKGEMPFPSAYLLKTSFSVEQLMKKGVSELHFVMRINIEDSEYFISSKEVKGLDVEMASLVRSKQILKEFIYADLSMYIVFSYSQSTDVVNVDATVVKRSDVYEAYGDLPVVISTIPRVSTRLFGKRNPISGGKKYHKKSKKNTDKKYKHLQNMRSMKI